MKNFDYPVKKESFKYITIIYPPQLESAKLMVQEHYDTAEYVDTLFLLNVLDYVDENGQSVPFGDDEYNHKRKIYYNFEHANDLGLEDCKPFYEYCQRFGITEVWSMEPNCETLDNELGVRYMPMRYTSLIQKSKVKSSYDFDLGFVGIVGSNGYSPRRNNFFHEYIINNKIDFTLKILNGKPISDFKDELANCKFILDTKRNYRHNMQNQVRIFEHLCLGHTVLSEKSEYNMFPGLIYEWETINELNNMVKIIEPEDMSEKYKEMTYTDEAYANYVNSLIYQNYTSKVANYYSQCGVARCDVINAIIKRCDYTKYLEIGINKGENFSRIQCNQKVGVDPVPGEYVTHVMTSDEYFASIGNDVKFDIVVIDGMHLWEFCYRDINNALKHLSPNGLIICHDMNPLYQMLATRNPTIEVWNGDVWKAFVKIRMERGDVYSCMIEDCDYGLGIVTFGMSIPLTLDKPFEDLHYSDFQNNKPYLMNTVGIRNFVEYNHLDIHVNEI